MAKKAANTIVKTPGEVKKINMDFAADLESGETLFGTPVFSSTPTGLSITGAVQSGTKAQAIFSSGTANVTYLVTCSVVTNNGQTYEGAGELAVQPLG